jgi:hypothetical protein
MFKTNDLAEDGGDQNRGTGLNVPEAALARSSRPAAVYWSGMTMSSDDPIDFDSTLVRQGRDAETFDQVSAFAREIEERSLDKLLEDLPGLAALSEWKFRLAASMFQRRFRKLPDVEKGQLRIFADEVAGGESPEIAIRIRALFERR